MALVIIFAAVYLVGYVPWISISASAAIATFIVGTVCCPSRDHARQGVEGR